ncbi:hypothetical protein O181_005980 [Austropuccinia psidii MF-1]|uniref:Uncharacterized protein n=1 Tax=Austropuccinia psidii MF-1 TaxID=1389203 RepID=A0A9Q3BJG2_9BASI|nr:hypothetical protein [Austropuccinia psidii MF-1]
MIQTLEYMVRRFCAYGLEFTDSDGFTHDWCTLIHALTFFIVALHGTNAVKVELSGELENKHPAFQVSLIKPYQTADKELFLLRNPNTLTLPPVEQIEDKKINKLIKERRLGGKNQREYIGRYSNTVHDDEWLAESEIPDSDKILRRFRHERRPQA